MFFLEGSTRVSQSFVAPVPSCLESVAGIKINKHIVKKNQWIIYVKYYIYCLGPVFSCLHVKDRNTIAFSSAQRPNFWGNREENEDLILCSESLKMPIKNSISVELPFISAMKLFALYRDVYAPSTPRCVNSVWNWPELLISLWLSGPDSFLSLRLYTLLWITCLFPS